MFNSSAKFSLALSALDATCKPDLFGSRASTILRRFRLSVAPRFLWECLTSRTVSWFPAPTTSNPSCRFPAMRVPARFLSRVMGLTRLFGVSVVTRVDEAGNYCRVPASDRATSYSTFSIRVLITPARASDVPECSSLPSHGQTKSIHSNRLRQSSSPNHEGSG